jgi:hypothetical protein
MSKRIRAVEDQEIWSTSSTGQGRCGGDGAGLRLRCIANLRLSRDTS